MPLAIEGLTRSICYCFALYNYDCETDSRIECYQHGVGPPSWLSQPYGWFSSEIRRPSFFPVAKSALWLEKRLIICDGHFLCFLGLPIRIDNESWMLEISWCTVGSRILPTPGIFHFSRIRPPGRLISPGCSSGWMHVGQLYKMGSRIAALCIHKPSLPLRIGSQSIYSRVRDTAPQLSTTVVRLMRNSTSSCLALVNISTPLLVLVTNLFMYHTITSLSLSVFETESQRTSPSKSSQLLSSTLSCIPNSSRVSFTSKLQFWAFYFASLCISAAAAPVALPSTFIASWEHKTSWLW